MIEKEHCWKELLTVLDEADGDINLFWCVYTMYTRHVQSWKVVFFIDFHKIQIDFYLRQLNNYLTLFIIEKRDSNIEFCLKVLWFLNAAMFSITFAVF